MLTQVQCIIRTSSFNPSLSRKLSGAIKVNSIFSQYDFCQHCQTKRNFHLSTPRYNSHKLSLKNSSVQKYMKNLVTSSGQSTHQNFRLLKVVHQIEEKFQELKELESLAAESEELREVAAKDKIEIDKLLQGLEDEFFQTVLDPEPFDHNDVVLEVSGAVGGQEAMLFASELFRMYENFANFHGYEFAVTRHEVSESGGLRQAHATISGHGVYQRFKYEPGVHRVQRVPKTEKGGRIHTSTATVAVLPLPTEIQVVLNPQDLKYEAKKASGAGGQHVNTTESAIRLTHIPTGTVVECQVERSQIRNRELALRILRARIYDKRLQEGISKRNSSRKLQVGLAGRSEKIRTYNYVQDRLTDHRIGLSLSHLKGILDGGEYFEQVVTKLQEFDYNERMIQLFDVK